MAPATPSVGSSEDEAYQARAPAGDLYLADDAVALNLDIRETISVSNPHNGPLTTTTSSGPDPLVSDNGVSECLDSPGTMSPRAYQLEMLYKSLRHNVIVAMDTGSGKTQVAVLRIKAELEECHPDQIIWFLAPTVSLCEQQFAVLQLQISSTSIKLLTGNDNVDTWSAPIWGAILDGTRVVISTYQILLDALSHAFVTMGRLALVVFDEAHNCVGKHPGSKIMTDFYHRRKAIGDPVPSVLALTATPSMRSSIRDLEALEALLDARCISPTIHREALLSCVKRPKVSHVTYNQLDTPVLTTTMRALHAVYLSLDMSRDPHILKLQADRNDRNDRALRRALEKYDTYSQNQMKGLWTRSLETCRQLGTWAADLYVWKAIKIYLDRIESDDILDRWMNAEKLYLSEALRQVSPPRPPDRPQGLSDISDKVHVLLQTLLSADASTVGIVFAKERATVTMLCEVLSSSSAILEKYRMGAMVGTSNFQNKRRAVYEFLGETDLQALQNFQSGKINLLVATAVLEEGIDVPACNLVICFDTPSTPKAFIQRRGRARMRESRLILLTEKSPGILTQWEMLEKEMTDAYRNEEREIRQLELLEESEFTGSTYFEVETTGARLDFDNAKQHLEHFCKVISQGEFVDSRPDYILRPSWEDGVERLGCTVLLPSVVPAGLRQADSAGFWQSEKNATKDAAFHAYVNIYKAGLLNENLLPFRIEEIPGVESRVPEIEVESPLQPWKSAARAWREHSGKWQHTISCHDQYGQSMGDYEIILPVKVDNPRPIQTYLSDDQECLLRFSSPRLVSPQTLQGLPDHTSTLLALHFSHRWHVEDKSHVVRIMVANETLSMEGIGNVPFVSACDGVRDKQYRIRDTGRNPHLYEGLLLSKPAADLVKMTFTDYDKAPENEPYLILSKCTKRSDFLHHVHSEPSKEMLSNKPYPRVFPLSWATVDSIPARHAQFGMLIPSVIHEIEVTLVAKELAETLLSPVGVDDIDLVREAISARSAGEPLNYERLEFLGDSILKYCASIQASVEHPTWPEGYLSYFKDRLVSNSRLSQAAVETGLAKFILARPFTGQKWRPLYLDDFLRQDSPEPKGRKLSTKTLADVVEALIGASYQDGGISKALKCISLFLHERQWKDIDVGRQILFDGAREKKMLPPDLDPLEQMIGYSFQKKTLLVEAMTHASTVMDHGQRSLERLEFLGDAILDYIIVTKLFSSKPPLPHHKMHMLKTAMVNSDFLAFVIMECATKRTEVVVTPDLEIVRKDVSFGLWNYMRHASLAIGVEHESFGRRHQDLRPLIMDAMKHGDYYPWAFLARLQAKKFYSDLFEALLGAVWVDSGSLEACEALVARFGIMPYLERLVRDEVNVQHPKEELGKWALSQPVTYAIDVAERGDGGKDYGCKVLVGQRVVAEVDDGVSKEEVKIKAAEVAVRFLATEKRALGKE